MKKFKIRGSSTSHKKKSNKDTLHDSASLGSPTGASPASSRLEVGNSLRTPEPPPSSSPELNVTTSHFDSPDVTPDRETAAASTAMSRRSESSDAEFDPADLLSVGGDTATDGGDTGPSQKKKKKKGVFGNLKVPKAFKTTSQSSKRPKSDGRSQVGDSFKGASVIGDDDPAHVESLDEFGAVRLKLDEAEQQRINLEHERDSLQIILETKNMTIAQLKSEVEELERKIGDLIPEATSPKTSARLDDIGAKLASLNAALATERLAKEQLAEELKQSKRALEEAQLEAEQLRQQLAKLESENSQQQNELNEVRTQLRERIVADASDPGLATELKKAQAELQIALDAERKSREEYNELRAELNKLRSRENDWALTESTTWKSEITSLRKLHAEEEARWQTTLDQFELAQEDLRRELTERNEEIEKLQREARFLREDLSVAQAERGAKDSETEQLKQTLKETQTNLTHNQCLYEDALRDLSYKAQQIGDLRERITQMSASDDAGRQELLREADAAQSAKGEIAHELSRAQAQLHEIDEQLERIKLERDEATRKAEAALNEANEVKEKMKNLQRQLETDVSNLTAEKSSLERESTTKAAKTEQKLADLNEYVRQLTANMRQIEESRDEAQRELERTRRQLDQMNQDVTHRTSIASISTKQLEEEIATLRSDKMRLSGEISEKTLAEARLANEITLLQIKLDVAEKANKDLQDQMRNLSQNKTEMNSAMSAREASAQRQLIELTSVRDRQQMQLESIQQREGDLKRELTDLRKERDDMNDSLARARKELSALQVENSILERRYADLRHENDTLKELNDELKRTSTTVLEDSLKKSQQVTLEVSTLTIKVQQLERTNEELDREIRNHKSLLSEVEGSRNALRAELHETKSALRETEDWGRQLEGRASDAEHQIANLKASMQEAFRRETALQEEIKSIRRNIKRNQKDEEEMGSSGVEHLTETGDVLEKTMNTPSATVYSNCIAHVDGQLAFCAVRCADGVAEVVHVLKGRLVDCLFELSHPRPPRSTVIGGAFGEAVSSGLHRGTFKEGEGRPEVVRVLARVRKLWQLGEDFRLALVQGDPTLAETFQATRTTHADWESTLESLRGSAEVIEDRNRELERLASGYSSALDEARALAKMDKEKAKSIINNLKKQLQQADHRRAVAEEDTVKLLKENERLMSSLQSTMNDIQSVQRPMSIPVASYVVPYSSTTQPLLTRSPFVVPGTQSTAVPSTALPTTQTLTRPREHISSHREVYQPINSAERTLIVDRTAPTQRVVFDRSRFQ